ncbi:MAG: hypothetical protein JWP48_5311 [Actinoallomurus sp.]|jgi:hypothetical protein|nr:hypothetical protein [Actinoallomurus sp.]
MSDNPVPGTAGLPERPRILTPGTAAVPGVLPPSDTWNIDRRPGARDVLPRRRPEPPASCTRRFRLSPSRAAR